MMILFASYFVPVVVLGVAVGSGRGLVVRLGIDSRLQILNEDAVEGFKLKNQWWNKYSDLLLKLK